MSPPNNIMHHGFEYLRTSLFAAVGWGVIHGREQERDSEVFCLPVSGRMTFDTCTEQSFTYTGPVSTCASFRTGPFHRIRTLRSGAEPLRWQTYKDDEPTLKELLRVACWWIWCRSSVGVLTVFLHPVSASSPCVKTKPKYHEYKMLSCADGINSSQSLCSMTGQQNRSLAYTPTCQLQAGLSCLSWQLLWKNGRDISMIRTVANRIFGKKIFEMFSWSFSSEERRRSAPPSCHRLELPRGV